MVELAGEGCWPIAIYSSIRNPEVSHLNLTCCSFVFSVCFTHRDTIKRKKKQSSNRLQLPLFPSSQLRGDGQSEVAGTVAFNCFQDAHCKLHFRKGMKVCIDGLHHKADNMVTI